jgi:hypothetical protein
MSPRVAIGVAAILLVAPARSGHTQVQRIVPVGRLDLFVSTRDIRRGIRENAYPVGQLDAIVGLRSGEVSLTAGAWGELEAHETSSEPRADLRAGPAGLSDWSAWIQIARQSGDLTLAAGSIRNFYRRVGGDPAVSELYASARLQAGRWFSSVSGWQAIAGAGGRYLEPTLGWVHVANPFTGPAVTWTSTLHAGVQVGARRPDGGAKVAGPLGTGLTYLAVGSSVRSEFGLGSIAVMALLGVEAQINRDLATRLRRDGTRGGWLRIWAPVQVGLALPARRRT